MPVALTLTALPAAEDGTPDATDGEADAGGGETSSDGAPEAAPDGSTDAAMLGIGVDGGAGA